MATYKILWDNGHSCGALQGYTFTNRREAERAAREWKREMVAFENTAAGRREAR
jgi:hypothetical protein